MENISTSRNWRIPPEPIPDSEIARDYSADVIVVGLGQAGTPAVRAAAEGGATVIGIEKMTREKYSAFGNDIGHINSEFLANRGVPKVDPVELFNEWMIRSGNRANPDLVMQFCQNCGKTFDWYLEPLTREQIDTIGVSYWDPPNKKFTNGIYYQKFWVGTAQFLTMHMRKPADKVKLSLTEVTLANQGRAKDHGADLHFGMDAKQLVKDGNRVTGVIAQDDKGQYLQYNANKGVILAAGDFGGSQEMMHDLVPDVVDIIEEGEKIRTQGRDGSGIRMGVWAGGRLEARPLATMGGNTDFPMSVIGSFGGTLWINEKGKRFCNEGFGDSVFAGFPGAQTKRQNITIVFDSNIKDHIQMSPPSHVSTWANEDTQNRLKNMMNEANTAGAAGYSIRGPGNSKLFAADTFEELADYAGFKGEAKENFLNTIKRFNEFCASGRDEDFGKGPMLLNALDNPPYYAQPSKSGGTVGFFLVTVGGLLTDEYQNVLNQQRDPIPGLYATGNCCGRRFGTQYSTPIAGVSIGIAITLGREAGKIVAKL